MTGTPTTPSAPPQRKTCGLAIASLICGIAGLCTAGLGSIAGVILGIVAAKKIGRSGGQLAGRGLAIGGIIASIVTLLIVLVVSGFIAVMAIGTHKAYTGVTRQVDDVILQSRVHVLGQMTMAYMADNQDRFPPPDAWPQALKDAKLLADDSMLADSRNPQAGRTVAMNALLAGKSQADVRRPNETVLYFECVPGSPPAGGRQNLPSQPRRPGGYVISFCDGHVEVVAKNNLGRLIWDPTKEQPNK